YEFHDEVSGDAEAKPRPSHLQIWLHLLPRWAWVIIGTTALLVAESVAARLATPPDSPIRMYWSLTQLGLGFLVFIGCQVFNLLVRATEDPDVGVLDLVLRPLKLWVRSWHELPRRLWIANGAINGYLATSLACSVIGGIPYERLLDWGIKQPPKENL